MQATGIHSFLEPIRSALEGITANMTRLWGHTESLFGKVLGETGIWDQVLEFLDKFN